MHTLYGLIGKKLSHSFSQRYFREKFRREGLSDCDYLLFEIEDAEEIFSLKKKHPELLGLNVTIPFKQDVIPLLDRLSPEAERIGAVNVIRFEKDGSLSGHNSDYDGFRKSLESFLKEEIHTVKALIFGTGGASQAVKAALEDLGIPFLNVSRSPEKAELTYADLNAEMFRRYALLINTTPLGMFPHTDSAPDLPFEELDSRHRVFDLVYNPPETLLMRKAAAQGARVQNGYEMLVLQAESAYQIWQSGR